MEFVFSSLITCNCIFAMIHLEALPATALMDLILMLMDSLAMVV